MGTTTTQRQMVKLEFKLDTFRAALAEMQREAAEELPKVLRSGAQAYITSAVKHTPPSLGKAKIDPRYYADGIYYAASGRGKAQGLRRVYDLLSLARDPSTGHYRKQYGRWLRQGYYYAVSIHRPGKPVRVIPVKTAAEAAKYAHETYRGLTRAAWGLSFAAATGRKQPPAIRELIGRRPELERMTGINSVQIDDARHEVTITNAAIPAGAPYLQSTDTNASIAAVSTMTDMMTKFLKKRRAL